MTPEQLERAREQLAPYGYTLTDAGEIVTPKAKAGGVLVTRSKAGLWHVRNKVDDYLYYSGPNLGYFLESFWYAKKR